MAYPNVLQGLLQQLCMKTFIDGARNSKIQQALRLARYKAVTYTLDHALEQGCPTRRLRVTYGLRNCLI